MGELLDNPAVQAGAAPFVVALLVAAVLARSRLMSLAIAAGFATVVGLTMGYSFETLTAVRKLVLALLATGALCVWIEWFGLPDSPRVRATMTGLAAFAALWVLQRLLAQKDTAGAIVGGLAACLFVALLVDSTLRQGKNPIRAGTAALMMGLGVGALALFGRSPLLAQWGVALGAASGAVVLVQMVRGRASPLGWTLSLPVAVGAGLLGILCVFSGQLPWFCLLPLLAVPWATRLAKAPQVWLLSIFSALLALVPVLLAVALAWFAVGLLAI